MAKEYKTQSGGTYTDAGWIPNRRHPMLGLFMPVKVVRSVSAEFPTPARREGALVFILPSGGEYVEH